MLEDLDVIASTTLSIRRRQNVVSLTPSAWYSMGAPVYGVLMSVDLAFGVENRSRDVSVPSPTDLLEAFFFSLLILVIELKTKQM